MTLTVDISISGHLASEVTDSDASSSETSDPETSNSETLSSADDDVPDPALLQTWATAAYLEDNSAIASMLVTTVEEIQQLNKQYRDKDKATNVLSFPMQTPEEVDVCLLGDIALCAQIIKREATQQSKPLKAHWAHMVVHGMLHLQGFDHIEEDEAEEMERLEIEILNRLGFTNPYQQPNI